MYERMYMRVEKPKQLHQEESALGYENQCLSCKQGIDDVSFQSNKTEILGANCKFCGNFMMVKKTGNPNEVRIISQGIKDNKRLAFQPDLQPKKVLEATY